MQRTKLGEQYVRFTVDGLAEAEAKTTATAGKVASTWSALRAKVASGFRGLGQAVLGVGAVAGGAIGFLTRGAMQGTVEADQLSTAWRYMSRTIGNEFAPYVRMATGLIVRLTDAWRNLSPQTKATIALVAVLAAGIAAAVATATAFAPIIGGALGGVTALLSGAMSLFGLGMGLVTAAVGASVSLMTAMVGASVTLMTTVVSAAIGFVVAVATGAPVAVAVAAAAVGTLAGLAIGAILAGAYEDVGALGDWFGELFSHWKDDAHAGGESIKTETKSWLGAVTQWIANAVLWGINQWNKLLQFINDSLKTLEKAANYAKDFWDAAFGDATGDRGRAIRLPELPKVDPAKAAELFKPWVEGADDAGQAIEQRLGNLRRLFPELKGDLAKALEKLKGGFTYKLDINFESLQDSFDRLQKTFAQGTDSDNVNAIRKKTDEVGEILKQIRDKLGGAVGLAPVGP